MNKAELLAKDADIEDVYFDTQYAPNPPQTKQSKLLDEMIGGLNDDTDDAYIAVYKQLGTGKESMSLVGKWPGDYFDSKEDLLLYLRDNFNNGGETGHYRVHVRVNGKLAANNLLSVESMKTNNDAAPTTDNTALNAILHRMEQQDQRMAQLYQQIASANQNQQGSKREFLEEMMLYKQLFSDNKPSGGLGEIRQALDFAREMGISVGTESDDGGGFGNAIGQLLPVLQSAIEKQPSQPQPQPQPNYQEQQKRDHDAMNIQVRAALYMLLQGAKTGADAGNYADMAITNVPENVLKEYAFSPNAFEKLCERVPDFKTHGAWFGDFVEHLKAQYGMPSKFSAEYMDDNLTPDQNPVNVTETIGKSDNAEIPTKDNT